MPFTLSHAAAALPLRRVLRGASVFPALVIGCFMPDVPYFLPGPLYSINVHALPGLVLFGLPCGWVFYALWQVCLSAPCAALLPKEYAQLLRGTGSWQPLTTRFVATTMSLFAGELSHVLWDAFTHRRGFVMHLWPALASSTVHIGDLTLPTYFVLQHLSTVIGLVCLTTHMRHRRREAVQTPVIDEDIPQLGGRAKIGVVAVLSIATMSCVAWMFCTGNAPTFSAYFFVCRTISTAATLTFVWALAWHAMQRLRGRR